MKKSLSIILVCFVLLTTFVTSAYAIETKSVYSEEAVYELTVGCVLKGDKINKDEIFSVEIIPEKDCPEFEVSSIDVKANQKGSFGTIKVGEPNVYNYRVIQRVGKNEKITYDETEYRVTLNVITNDEGLVTATQVIENLATGDKVDGIEFVNTLETEIPKTSDASTLVAWGIPLVLLIFSLGVVFVSFVKISKKEKANTKKDENEE
ncbi:MAG: FctA domain-containing protein [Acutalibacteraceae bacterium]|nr:FctA domain-containing protein [Acutalibacteraceae bacterium]